MPSRKTITSISLATAIVFLPFSIALCHLSLAIFLACWITEGNWKEKSRMLSGNYFVWAYALFFGLHLAGVIYSENSSSAWFNIEKKVTLLLLPIALASLPALGDRVVRNILLAFVAACFCGTLICLYFAGVPNGIGSQQNFDGTTLSLYRDLNPYADPRWLRFSYIELASGIGMHPTFLAMYLVFCLVLLYHLYAESFATLSLARRSALLFIALYFILFILLLSSRAVTLALLILSLVGLYQVARRSVPYGVAFAFVIAGMVAVVLVDPVSRYRSLQEPFTAASYQPGDNGVYTYSTGIRKSLWILGALGIAEVNPFFGAGTGDVESIVRKMSEDRGIRNIIGSYDPHNEFIFIQLALGGAGLLAFMACLGLPLWAAWRQRKYLYMAFIFLFASVCVTESALESQKGIVFFSIFSSILAFQYCKLEPVVRKKLVYG